jgi:hypothetical protein
MAIDSTGVAHVVYADNGAVYYLRREISSTWTVPITITTAGTAPAIALSPSGDVEIVWANTGSTYYRHLSASGVLSDSMLVSGDASDPDIGVDSSGTIHVMYTTHNPWIPLEEHVGYRYLQSDGSWSSASLTGGRSPHLAFRTDNVLLYVATSSAGVYLWSHPALYYGEVGDYSSYSPRLAVDSQNNAHLLWNRYPAIGRYGIRVPHDGLVVGETIPDYSGTGDIGVDSAGNVFVANTDGNAVYFRVKPQGNDWYPSQTITDTGSSTPVIKIDQQDNAHLIYKPVTTSTIEYRVTTLPTRTLTSQLSQQITIPISLHRPTLSFWYQLDQTK